VAPCSDPQALTLSAIATVCDLDPAAIPLEAELTAIGLDSLGRAGVIDRVEAMSGCELTPEQMLQFFNVRCVCDLIELVSQITRDGEPVSGA
jgi:acyl carrier protein